MRSLNLSSFDIRDRFFQGFHLWLPVISPTPFYEHDTLTCPLSADLSVLLLAMCLIAQHTAVDTLYASLRILFAQAQTAFCSSVTLVQAGLLISAYEYTRGWLDAAYISIGTCVRMAYTISINNDQREKLVHNIGSKLSAHESWNIWWGVVVLERSIDSFRLGSRPERLLTIRLGLSCLRFLIRVCGPRRTFQAKILTFRLTSVI